MSKIILCLQVLKFTSTGLRLNFPNFANIKQETLKDRTKYNEHSNNENNNFLLIRDNS